MTEEEQDLSRKVALACGWRMAQLSPSTPRHFGWRHPSDTTYEFWQLPAFATSLDACFGPGGPVEWLAAKGGDCGVSPRAGWAHIPGNWSHTYNIFNTTMKPAAALCRAILDAVAAVEARGVKEQRPRSCNRHRDCEAFDEGVRLGGGKVELRMHCQDDDCEDCFGK